MVLSVMGSAHHRRSVAVFYDRPELEGMILVVDFRRGEWVCARRCGDEVGEGVVDCVGDHRQHSVSNVQAA